MRNMMMGLRTHLRKKSEDMVSQPGFRILNLRFGANFFLYPFHPCDSLACQRGMRTILPLILLLLAAASCQDAVTLRQEGLAQPFCGIEDPVKELAWLRDKVDSIKSNNHAGIDFFVVSAVYHDEPVFFVDICCPFCMVMAPDVRNCRGEVLGRLADGIA